MKNRLVYRFSFAVAEKKEAEYLILNQEVNKASQISNIPLKVVKSVDIFSDFECARFIISINLRKFPKHLKLAHITPLHRKGKKDIKGKYRSISILFLNYQKYLKSVTLQKCPIFYHITSKYQCGF